MNRPIVELPQYSDGALIVRHTLKPGFRQRYLITSDIHWDSPECYIKLVHEHLREAKETAALVIDNGDFFDVISGAGDKRGSKGAHLEEHNHVDYLDRLVDEGVDEFRAYADQFMYMGRGNHDWAITIKKETDIMRRFIEQMNEHRSVELPKIHSAGYTGWIRFMFSQPSGACRFSHAMKLEHGTGGNSPVTKGVIQASRRQTQTHGATFFVSGHIHEQWQLQTVAECLNLSTSRVEQRRIEHIQVGSYKQDFRTDGVGTWFQQKIGTAKPIGGQWLEFSSRNGRDIEWTVTPAWVDYSKLPNYLRAKGKFVRGEVA